MRKLKLIYLTIFLTILYLPIAVLIINSFNNSLYSIRWEGFTLKWYDKLFKNFALIESVQNSLILGFLSSLCSLIIGVIISFGLYKYKYFGSEIIYFLIQMMFVLPDSILGVSLLIFFILIGFQLGFYTLLISHVILSLPFSILIIFSGFKELNKELIEASKDLGASDYEILKKIIIPIIFPNITIAFIISFSLSLDDALVSYFVSGPQYEIFPLIIFSLTRIGIKPEINAACALILFIAVCTHSIIVNFMKKIK